MFGFLLFSGCNKSEKQNDSDHNSEEKIVADTLKAKKEEVSVDTLLVTPLAESGDLGRVTFTKGEKTYFYFDRKLKKGKIVFKNVEYVLEKETFASEKDSYVFSGTQITVEVPEVKFEENTGSDCFYGKCPVVTIKSSTESTQLKNLSVQDCPNN